MQILSIVREILSTPALLVGLVVLFGLLLQKKPVDHVIKGTATAVIGFVLLTAGSIMLQNGALKDFSVLFQYDFHIQGVIPNMEAVSSLGIAEYATTVSMMMFFGMIANIVVARYSRFHYVFLTGHHTLYMACLLTVVLGTTGMKTWEILLAGSLLLGLLMAMLPALMQKEVNKVTGNDKIALGHFSVISYLVAAKTAKLVARKDGEKKSTEEIAFPTKLSFMRDSMVGIFIVMTLVFMLVAGVAAAQTDLAKLDISYASDSFQNWLIYSVIQGARFSASVYIILAGVRLIIAEIVPAFKGIAKKIVPNAKPAVDCPILFNYAPNAVMIGFLMSFLGGVCAMALLVGVNAFSGEQLLPIIVPGVAAHFFCGASAGVFANAEGGIRGCVIGSFVHGVLITFLALAVMPVLGTLNMSGTTFSDADFCVVGVLLGNLSRILPHDGVLWICVICFFLPIIWEQSVKRKRMVKE